MMRFLHWTLRFIVFLALLAFAAKNTQPVTLRFYFDLAWQAPLVALLLGFFAGGVALGLLAMVGTLLRQRSEIRRLRREARKPSAAEPARALAQPELPPAVDG